MPFFKSNLREIDSSYPPISPRHVKGEILSFPTVCGMPMENFFTKMPVSDKVCFESDFLKKRPIELDETFFVGKLLFSSFWNGMALVWSLKLIIGTHFSSISTAVHSNPKFSLYSFFMHEAYNWPL